MRHVTVLTASIGSGVNPPPGMLQVEYNQRKNSYTSRITRCKRSTMLEESCVLLYFSFPRSVLDWGHRSEVVVFQRGWTVLLRLRNVFSLLFLLCAHKFEILLEYVLLGVVNTWGCNGY